MLFLRDSSQKEFRCWRQTGRQWRAPPASTWSEIQRAVRQRRRKDPCQHPQYTSQHAESNRFAEKLQLDIPFGSSNGEADSDLPSPLGDRHQHDIHDSDPAYQQREGCHARQQNRHDSASGELRLNQILRPSDIEIVILGSGQVVTLAKQACDLVVASVIVSRETAEQKMSSSQNVPVILFCTVVKGMTTKSS